MPDDPLVETLVRVRKLLVDLEAHLDRAGDANDVSEIGRAWVRAVQVEHLLCAALPPGAAGMAETEEAARQAAAIGDSAAHLHADRA